MDGMKMTALSSYGKLSQRISPDRQFGERNRGRGALKSVLFAVPKKARTVKPFVDHVISFLIVDGKIWLHNSLANGELNASPDSLLWAALACEWFPCGPVALRRPQGGEALGGCPPGSQSRGALVLRLAQTELTTICNAFGIACYSTRHCRGRPMTMVNRRLYIAVQRRRIHLISCVHQVGTAKMPMDPVLFGIQRRLERR
ncbi:hypothetical protein PGT21_024108 [Puccinia graminis f. sp. tritici]|uniref:Uncharacterized protein n=1 Tax=Puccinia graminis f. sp. tritici TaxID=56615 RepID=A0A5B0QNE4_PUCGR|nr:hypothetical protein PGT21_024108 [Puccinia graminis f. sp. tritici]